MIAVDDVRLAVSSKVGHSFRGPPPKEFLLEVAAERNRRPLPAVREGVEIRLPPERWCLNTPNWESLVLENESLLTNFSGMIKGGWKTKFKEPTLFVNWMDCNGKVQAIYLFQPPISNHWHTCCSISCDFENLTISDLVRATNLNGSIHPR